LVPVTVASAVGLELDAGEALAQRAAQAPADVSPSLVKAQSAQ
jgi:hypothetical protein